MAKTQPKSNQYGPFAREVDPYDTPDSKIEEDDAASRGDRQMDVLRNNTKTAPQVPTRQDVQTLERKGNANVQQDSQNVTAVARVTHLVANIEGEIPSIGTNANPGPLAGEVNAVNRCRDFTIGLLSGMLGISLGGAGGLVLGMKLGGYVFAAESIATGAPANTPECRSCRSG